MPQVQTIDTSSRKPEPSGVEQFFSRLGKDYKDKEDRVEIGNLINEYQNNRQDKNAWENLQLNLEKNNRISPTKRIETQKSLNEIQKGVIEKDKILNAKVKLLEDDTKKKVIADEKKLKDEALAKEKTEKTLKTASEVKEILISGGEEPEEAERLSTILSPSSANSRVKQKNAQKKIDTEKTDEEKAKNVTQKAFNDIVKLVPKAGRGTKAFSYFGGEDAKTYGEFTSLTGALESLLVEKVNRGTLSNTRFKYITETLLPKAYDTKAEITGKLKGLSVILELDDSELNNLDKKTPKKEEKPKEVNRAGFVKIIDPQGIERWVPESIANKIKGQL